MLCARERGYVRPRLTVEDVIDIRGGRHPLGELCVQTFVPNDTAIGKKCGGTIKIITGPNCSGKSVYLQQIGLIVFMAHIGSFVPAESATIGVCDAIFTRLKNTETATNGMSMFSTDCAQIAKVQIN